MRIVRAEAEGRAFFGVLDGERVRRLRGLPYAGLKYDGREYPLAALRLLPPVQPQNVVCVGRNYYDHIKELNNEVPEEPLLFYKPVTSIVGHEGEVIYPRATQLLHHEAELAVVIGKKATAIQPGASGEYIFGYACLNDITARDLQRREKQFARSKGCDTCCPIGPWIETQLNAQDVVIRCRVNGALRQEGSSSLMMHSIDELICYITQCITLYPGDVIATGTPAGVGPMERGDVVEVDIEGIGILRNRIV